MILGISGKSGSGKSKLAWDIHTSSHQLYMPYSFVRSLSTPLIESCRTVLPTTTPYVKPYTEEERKNLQDLGMWLRERNPDALIECMCRYGGIDKWYKKNTLAIIDDIRFPNEASWVRHNRGLLVRLDVVHNPLEGEASTHESETALDDWTDWDGVYTLENSAPPLLWLMDILRGRYDA